ncbi:uncharacterized protein GGS22DRAFT_11304 [Annulohypoxylon maeteangense]|uniref:uncharacterized protein n=1 Tax=Annulohypoxylon maeteangense TaxID=1927788 RepID=UPI002007C35B|nr:uncharacterized protein GGS22DRAFT_11304 [Annulohypoxylon maeteangense]KAI0890274.1 hypothetical protein GGS22DRAFT_11304 [Annulohypoxylon maeteangense]
MGSNIQEDPYTLPDATAPSLVLTHPTEDEKRRTWTLNHREWGGALSLEDYLKREPYLTTIPLTRDGGMTHWVLTDSSWPAESGENRPILASCESISKRILVASPGDTAVRDGVGHGVGSVFTYPEHRGNRYAGRMLNELGTALRTWQCEKKGSADVVCSALWSDIGKTYYAKKGWAVFPSLHIEFPVPANQTQGSVEIGKGKGKVSPITYENLGQLCETDEKLVREQVLRKARETNRTCVAFAPDHDTMRWHLYRDDFIASILFKSSPGPTSVPSSIKGVIAGTQEGRRVWAVWSRNYYGGSGKPTDNVEKNTLYILRLVIESEASEGEKPSEDVVEGFTAVLRTALHEAAIWNLGKVDLWNPSPLVKTLIERSGVQHRPVERDVDSIPSMMWYGDEKISEIEWVANEKYCWC